MATSVISVPGSLKTARAANREGSVPERAPPPGREFSGGAKMPRSFASSRQRAKDRSKDVKGGHELDLRARAASAGDPARDRDRSAGRRASNLEYRFCHQNWWRFYFRVYFLSITYFAQLKILFSFSRIQIYPLRWMVGAALLWITNEEEFRYLFNLPSELSSRQMTPFKAKRQRLPSCDSCQLSGWHANLNKGHTAPQRWIHLKGIIMLM